MIKHNRKLPELQEASKEELYLAPAPPEKGKIYAIDHHPDVNVTAVVTGSTPHNMKVEETRGKQTLEQLVSWLADTATAEDIILVEASGGSFELERRISQLKLTCCVLESSWIGQQASKYVDSDKLAAVRIARVYLQGNAKAVWIPDQKTIERRHLLHLQITAKRDRTQAINRLRGFLTQYGVRPGKKTLSNKNNQEWIRGKREWSEYENFILEDLISEVNRTTKRSQEIESKMGSEIAKDPVMLTLMSLLGIGTITAFAMVAVIGDIRRFATPKKLAAYLGLNPSSKTSGKGKHKKIGVAVTGRRDVRSILTQGAQAVLRQGSKSALGKWGMSLFLRKGNKNIAVSAIARRLAMQVWHILMGHRTELLEPTKSRNVKFGKLLAMIGKEGREKIDLPKRNLDSISLFNQMISDKITI